MLGFFCINCVLVFIFCHFSLNFRIHDMRRWKGGSEKEKTPVRLGLNSPGGHSYQSFVSSVGCGKVFKWMLRLLVRVKAWMESNVRPCGTRLRVMIRAALGCFYL